MMEIFHLELINNKKSYLGWTIGLAFMSLLFLAFFPSMQTEEMQGLAFAKLESISSVVLAVLGLDSIPDFSKIHPYFGYVMQYLNLAIAIFATSKGASQLIREETEGTIEYLYAKPVSRSQIFFQKTAGNTLALFLTVTAFFLATIGGFIAFASLSLNEALQEAMRFYPGTLFVTFIFLAVGIFLSTVLASSRQATSAVLGIVFTTFLLGAIAIISPKFDFLTYLSPLDWVKSITDNPSGPNTAQALVGFGIILISLMAGFLFYKRKDLKI